MKKLLFSLLAVIFFLGSCKKDFTEVVDEKKFLKSDKLSLKGGGLTKVDYFKLLAEEFLITANNSTDFKKWMYENCFAQDSGDYYISVDALLLRNAQSNYPYWSASKANYIKEEIIDKIKGIDMENEDDYTEPIVFIPFIEDINLDSLLLNCPTGAPKAVISMEYDSTTTYCPGYNLNNEDSLVFYANNIDEEYAWSHDLWVFGQQEILNSDNMVSGRTTSDEIIISNRFNGQSESGGIIQVTNLGALEPWVEGKFEFRFFVFNSTGTRTNEIALGKQKRKKFKNQQWVDFNKFLFFWNISNIGNWTIEAWIEEDGGGATSTVSQTIPPPCTGCPSTTISYSKQKKDYVMGQSIVQFSDPISTAYSISHANFKRKN